MTIFAILMPSTQPNLAARIRQAFPQDHLSVNDTQWLISTTGTAENLSSKLGIYNPANPSEPFTGNAIVFATSSYFGRAPSNIWDWIKVKLESSPSG